MAKRVTTNKRHAAIVSEYKSLAKDVKLGDEDIYYQLGVRYFLSTNTIKQIVMKSKGNVTIEEVIGEEAQPQRILVEIILKESKIMN